MITTGTMMTAAIKMTAGLIHGTELSKRRRRDGRLRAGLSRAARREATAVETLIIKSSSFLGGGVSRSTPWR
jgi:hypothetical protein